MRNEIDEMTTLAGSFLKSLLAASPDDNGTFRLLVTTGIGDAPKPMLMIGNTHRHYYEDAYSIAILNPDESLLSDVRPGVAYTRFILKEMVSKRCDAMVLIWLEGGNIRQAITYRARRQRPATFVVR